MNLSKTYKKRLWIYVDEGVSAPSADGVFNFFQSYNQLTIGTIRSQDLKSIFLDPERDMLCFPGGRDIPYQEKLQGEGVKRIRQFVLNGGTYIGICAGAYFACDRFEFEKGTELEIVAERDLKFYSKTGVGPILGLGKFDYYSDSGVEYPLIKFEKSNFACPIYYNGGLGFIDLCKNSEVIARYPNEIPAILKINNGLGTSFLSGVHFEMLQNESHLKKVKKIVREFL